VPKGPRKFHFSFEKVGLTRFGGLSLFKSFCKSLGLRHFLQLYVRWPDYHRRNYHPADLFLAHLFSMVAGIGRIENAQSLIHNGLIPPLLGLPEFPHRDTLRSFLWRFGPNEFDNLVAAHDRLRHDFFHRLGLLHSAIVDADTTALLTYGHQEGVAVGFVPKKRHGQPSYAPIISSEGRCGLTLGMELRAGNVHPTIGALSFLNQMLDKLPSSIAATRTRLRLDGAFYDRKIIEAIDQERIGYAVSAKMTRPLRNKMIAARYQPFAQGWEAAAFSYMPFRWQKQHRFVAVRRAAALEPESIQQRLFTFKQYTYHQALVTNLEPTPAAVWRFYCDRGFQELLLREFKGSYTMAKIPTRSFWANAAYMEMVLWAYDLVLAFQYLCLPEEIRNWNIATLRRELWWLPAEWVRRENRNVLVLPAKYPRQDLFLKIQQASEKVRPII
jgi:hypothetical protein